MPDAQGRITAEDYAETDEALQANLELYCGNCVKIKAKDGNLVPLIWNNAQRTVHQKIERQLELTGKVRVLVLKARQRGISTYVMARFYHKTTLCPGFGILAYILTHLAEATQNLFGMVKRTHENMPPEYRHELTRANANELRFKDMDSGYGVGTAKNVSGTGRSLTIHLFHGSEAAFWASAQDHIAGVLQAVPNARGTEVILESTANGVGGAFYDLWQAAERGENDFLPIFLPWFGQEDYRVEVPEGFEPSIVELEYMELHQLDMEQIAWMRATNTLMGGQPGEIVPLFRQEYPGTAQEAFQVTGSDSLIRPDAVTRARHFTLEDDPKAPMVMGVDTAEGGKDKTRMLSRKGRRLGHHINITIDERDQMILADAIAVAIRDHDVKMTFIDTTNGRGAYDRLVQMGFGDLVRAINFGANATEVEKYANKRAEMWCRMRDATEDPAGLDMIDDDVLHEDMCAPGYRYDEKRRYILERKDQVKKRLERQRSPDAGDAAALTYAETVTIPEPKKESWTDTVMTPRNRNWMTR